MIDADCTVAGTLARSGAACHLLDLWREGEFELVVCPRLVHEVREAMHRPRIAGRYGITPEEANELARRIREEAIRAADPINPPRVVPEDPDDDYLVALALENDADALIRRDHHFDKVAVPGLRILFPGELLAELRG
ncbi:MAG: PIN domain-containing protein [Candidatus Dormibacterales bacterium]